MVKITTLILLIAALISCSKLKFRDDDLVGSLQPNTSNALRLGGYYYIKDDIKVQSFTFLYRNGVILDAGGSVSTLADADIYVQKEFVEGKFYKEDKDGWGLYMVTNSSVKIERWYAGQGARKSYISYGEILNDTTFHITHSTRSDGSEEREKDEIYYFRAFSPKPDSTNTFVHP